MPSFSFKIPVKATSYSSGTCVGGLLKLTDLGNSGAITSVVIRDVSANAIAYDLKLFKADLTVATTTDNVAFAINGDLAKEMKTVAIINTISSSGTGGGSITQDSIYSPYAMDGGAKGPWAVLIARGSATFAATTDLSMEIMAERLP